jgi:hypothetical protein
MAFRIVLIISMLLPMVRVYAQTVQADTVLMDSVIHKKFAPTGLRIGADVVSPIKTQIRDDFTGWEFGADVDIHRYLLSAEVGHWGRNFRKDSTDYSSTYSNNGSYWRVGIDVNFLTHDPERNVFFLGMRYARAKYSENMAVIATDDLWGTINHNYSNNGISANWLELNLGLKVKIYKVIWMGYRGSMKFGLKKDSSGEIVSHDVPGYGSTFRDTTFGFTYSIYVRIPFRKTVPILPPKKK